MTDAIAAQIEALEGMTVAELRERHLEVFDEPTNSAHKQQLIKKLAWGIQARAQGGLSERAQRRAKQLARESDLRLFAPRGRTEVHRFAPAQDRGALTPGTILEREYKGRVLHVTVLDQGFLFEGETYRSLSAVAKAVTGSHWSGTLFFRLSKGRKKT